MDIKKFDIIESFIQLIEDIVMYIYHLFSPIKLTSEQIEENIKKNFKIRIVPSWFSDNYVSIQYTIDGHKWKRIQTCEEPFLYRPGYGYNMKDLVYSLGNGDFKWEKEKFSTYEKIKEYESAENKKCVNGNEELRLRWIREKEQKEAAYKKANE